MVSLSIRIVFCNSSMIFSHNLLFPKIVSRSFFVYFKPPPNAVKLYIMKYWRDNAILKISMNHFTLKLWKSSCFLIIPPIVTDSRLTEGRRHFTNCRNFQRRRPINNWGRGEIDIYSRYSIVF